ncbi:MAG: type II toxin-antitoxin system HicB family antitoxin [Thermomicrobiales bacterium]
MKGSGAPLRYSMLIQWSDEDDAFLVTLPEWDGRVINPVTHGASYEEAVGNGREVLQLLVELSLEQGQPLPQPQRAVVAA